MNSAKETFEATQKQFNTIAGNGYEAAQGGVHDALDRFSRIVKIARNFGLGDVLATVGLRRGRRSSAAILSFGGGVVLGAGLGLLFAPMTGSSLRGKIGQTFGLRTLSRKLFAVERQAEAAIVDNKMTVPTTASQAAAHVVDSTEKPNQSKDGVTPPPHHRVS